MTKEEMERVWARPGVQHPARLCRWSDRDTAGAGALVKGQSSKAVLAFRRAVIAYAKIRYGA